MCNITEIKKETQSITRQDKIIHTTDKLKIVKLDAVAEEMILEGSKSFCRAETTVHDCAVIKNFNIQK